MAKQVNCAQQTVRNYAFWLFFVTGEALIKISGYICWISNTHTDILQSLKNLTLWKKWGENPTHTRRLKRSRFNGVKVQITQQPKKTHNMTQTWIYFSGKAFHSLHSNIYAVEVPTCTLLTQQMSFYFFLLPKSDTNCSSERAQKKQQKQERVFLSPRKHSIITPE